MVFMAADDSELHAKVKEPVPVSPSPPSAAPATRTPLHAFTFPSWGRHRLLRCSKDGATAPAPALASPPTDPKTPSPPKEKPQGAATAPPAPRPWNLRARRSGTAAPLAKGSEGAGKAAAAWQVQPPPAKAAKRGFSVALTKEEIAADFLAITGARLPRRPKKRPRAVQRQLDMLYPGLSLADVNLDSYKIDER